MNVEKQKFDEKKVKRIIIIIELEVYLYMKKNYFQIYYHDLKNT